MTNLIQITNNQATTTSLKIAEVFGKDHDKVLRSIRSLSTDLPREFNEANFGLVKIKDSKGELRPSYNLTRDGFTLLAMGFTGKKALEFKIAYIKAFNEMEAELYGKSLSKPKTKPKNEQLTLLESLSTSKMKYPMADDIMIQVIDRAKDETKRLKSGEALNQESRRYFDFMTNLLINIYIKSWQSNEEEAIKFKSLNFLLENKFIFNGCR